MENQENREKWIQTLYNLRLQNFAATFLEALGPLNLIGAQLVYIGQPILSSIFSKEQSQGIARILEDPSETALFIKELRAFEPSN